MKSHNRSMFRSTLLLILTAITPVLAQQGSMQTVSRPVLKALPIGGDEDTGTRPLPIRNAAPPMVPAPATASASPPLPGPASTTPVPPLPPAAPIPALETPQLPSPIDAKPTGDDAVRLQIFLDEAKFGPGVIDGKPGRFTELAVFSWNEVNGHPVDSLLKHITNLCQNPNQTSTSQTVGK